MPGTDSNILNYKGNASLAGGLSNEPTPAGIGADNLSGFNKTMSEISQQDYNWNVMQYAQKVKERDDMYNLLASEAPEKIGQPGGSPVSVPVLEEDRPILQKLKDDINNKVINAVKKNGGIQNNVNDYLAIKGYIDKFNEMQKGSQSRYLEIAKLKQQYANSFDPDEKKVIADHIDNFRNKGPLTPVDPVQKLVTIDFDKYAPKVEPDTTDVGTKGDKLLKKEVTDQRKFLQAYDPNQLSGSEALNLAAQAQRVYNHFTTNPGLMSDANIMDINNKIDEANKEWGSNYQHIADKNPDGTWKITVDPIGLRLALGLQKNFVNNQYAEVSKLPSEIAENRQQIQTGKATAANSWANAGYTNEQTRQLKLMADANVQQAVNKANINKAQGKQAAEYVNNYLTQFGNYAESKNYAPANELVKDKNTLSELKNQTGIQDNTQLIELPKGETSLSKLFKQEAFGYTKYPDRLFMAKDVNGETKLIGQIPSPGGGYEFRTLNIKDAIGEAIKADNGKDNSTTPVIISNTEAVLNNMPGNTWQEKYRNMIGNNTPSAVKPMGPKKVTIAGEELTYSNNKFYDASGNVKYVKQGDKFYTPDGKEVK